MKDVIKFTSELEVDKLEKCSPEREFVKAIYFLYDGDELVYVGKTTIHPQDRINVHITDRNKTFTSYSVVELNHYTNGQLSVAEELFILRFNPKYNKVSKVNRLKRDLFQKLQITDMDSVLLKFEIKEEKQTVQ